MEDKLVALLETLVAELGVVPPRVDPERPTSRPAAGECLPAPAAASAAATSPATIATAAPVVAPLLDGGDPLHRQVRRLDGAETVTWDYSERTTEGFRGPDGGPLSDISRALLTSRDHARAAETVIGSDDRTRVLHSHEFPWRMIVALRIEMAGSVVRHGTGFLVGPSTLLTAGHCVYEPRSGGWAERVEIRAGLSGSREPFGSITSKSLSTSLGWVDLQDHRYDYAFVELDEPLGERTGWFSLGVLPAAEIYGSDVNVCGYPSDVNRDTWHQWHCGGRTGLVDGQKLYYDADTFGGTSGGPVWIARADGSQVVVGVHAYGTRLSEMLLSPHNSATRVIPHILDHAAAHLGAQGDRRPGRAA